MHAWTGAPRRSRRQHHREQRRHQRRRALVWADATRTGSSPTSRSRSMTKKYAAGTIVAASAAPSTKTHELHLPRVAILHTWLRTQDEGWFRLGARIARHPVQLHLDAGSVAHAEPSRQIRRHPLRADRRQQLIRRNRERTSSRPAAAVAQDRDHAEPRRHRRDRRHASRPRPDRRRHLTRFVEDGGLLITARDTSIWAVQYGLARWVRVIEPQKLRAPGTILLASVTDKKSPDRRRLRRHAADLLRRRADLPGRPRRRRPRRSRVPSGRGGKNDPDVPQGRPFVPLPERPKPAPGEEGFQTARRRAVELRLRVAARRGSSARDRLVRQRSRQAPPLRHARSGDEIAGKPVVIDAPRGKGHILLFANNPMWRQNTQGSYALVTNAIMNWDHGGIVGVSGDVDGLPTPSCGSNQYERFKDERAQPFRDLAALIEPRPHMRIVDLGCGTGELTRELHEQLGRRRRRSASTARESMLQKAIVRSGDAALPARRHRSFVADRPFDLVFSNAALHWIRRSRVALRAPDRARSRRTASSPCRCPPTTTTPRTASPPRSRRRSASSRAPSTSSPPSATPTLLHHLGFTRQHVRLQVYGHVLPSTRDVVEWTKGSTLTPYREALSPERYEEFLAAVHRRARRAARRCAARTSTRSSAC